MYRNWKFPRIEHRYNRNRKWWGKHFDWVLWIGLRHIGDVEVVPLTEYNIRIVQNCMSEYIVMYLNRPNDVTSAHRPSNAKCLTQLIFCSLDVNGAATDASAWKSHVKFKLKSNEIELGSSQMQSYEFYLWQWNSNVSCLQTEIRLLFTENGEHVQI